MRSPRAIRLAGSRSGRRAARSLLAPAASLLAAAALAGCGPFGDDESDEREFAHSGDEICREARAQFDELQRDLPTTEKQSVRFTQRLIAIFEDELAELEALEPPADRRAAYTRYLRARRRAIGYIDDGLAAAQGGNALAYADAQARVANEQVERAELAKQSGLNECSRPVAGGGGPGR
jgi:hypothetical protein